MHKPQELLLFTTGAMYAQLRSRLKSSSAQELIIEMAFTAEEIVNMLDNSFVGVDSSDDDL